MDLTTGSTPLSREGVRCRPATKSSAAVAAIVGRAAYTATRSWTGLRLEAV